MAETKKQTATKTKTTSEIDLLSNLEVSKATGDRIRRDVGDFLIDSILDRVGSAESPVSGESFPKLSEDYKKKKASEGGTPIANLELTGSMLDNLKYRPTASGIEIGIFGDNAPKADGHNNFSGKSRIPTRRFLPGEGQVFKKPIDREIQNIVDEHVARSQRPKKSDLARVETKAQLNDLIRKAFPSMGLAQAKSTILRDELLSDLFGEFDLLRLF